MVIMARTPRSRSGSIGRLSYKPTSDEGLVPKTLEFIRVQLPAWRDDPRRPAVSSEKQLNSSLCDFLDSRSRSEFPMVRFKHEAPQARARTADMGVHGAEEITLIGSYGYTIYEPFTVIECKRLPAPSKDREREYVSGTNEGSRGATGGIQRFKLGLHGDKVEIAAIVGCIEKETVRHWYAKINQWIIELATEVTTDGCIWSDRDKLQELSCDDKRAIATTASIHRRANTGVTKTIKLHHFWVVMRLETN
jgi:hypothetical protein